MNAQDKPYILRRRLSHPTPAEIVEMQRECGELIDRHDPRLQSKTRFLHPSRIAIDLFGVDTLQRAQRDAKKHSLLHYLSTLGIVDAIIDVLPDSRRENFSAPVLNNEYYQRDMQGAQNGWCTLATSLAESAILTERNTALSEIRRLGELVQSPGREGNRYGIVWLTINASKERGLMEGLVDVANRHFPPDMQFMFEAVSLEPATSQTVPYTIISNLKL